MVCRCAGAWRLARGSLRPIRQDAQVAAQAARNWWLWLRAMIVWLVQRPSSVGEACGACLMFDTPKRWVCGRRGLLPGRRRGAAVDARCALIAPLDIGAIPGRLVLTFRR